MGCRVEPCNDSESNECVCALAHEDVYKQEVGLPVDLVERTADLADQLAIADKIAQKVRLRVAAEVIPPEEAPDLGSVSDAGLAYIFGLVFGRYPSDYVVRRARQKCHEFGISELYVVQSYVANKQFRERVNATFRESLGLQASADYVFLVAPTAAAHGEERALAEVREEVRRELDNAEAIWKDDVLSGLPDTPEELISLLEHPPKDGDIEYDITQWADAVGAACACGLCFVPIVDAEALGQALAEHYDLDEEQAEDFVEAVAKAVLGTGVDGGHWKHPLRCTRCGESWERDD